MVAVKLCTCSTGAPRDCRFTANGMTWLLDRSLQIGSNSLNGTVPSGLSSLRALVDFQLQSNSLNGSILGFMTGLTALTYAPAPAINSKLILLLSIGSSQRTVAMSATVFVTLGGGCTCVQ